MTLDSKITPEAFRALDSVDSRPPAACLRPRSTGACGFTGVEVIVVLAVVAIIVTLGIPAILGMMSRSRLQGASQEVAVHLLLSRLEAMKMGNPVVVVPDYPSQTLFAFIDEDDDLGFDAAVEEEVYRLALPGASGARGIYLMGPDGVVGTEAAPAQSVEGLTPVAGGNLRVAVFEPNGSVRDPGAFRLSDAKSPEQNLMEIRVAPQATARIEVRKLIYDAGGEVFRPYGAGLWDWY